jgi:hypothetical protein
VGSGQSCWSLPRTVLGGRTRRTTSVRAPNSQPVGASGCEQPRFRIRALSALAEHFLPVQPRCASTVDFRSALRALGRCRPPRRVARRCSLLSTHRRRVCSPQTTSLRSTCRTSDRSATSAEVRAASAEALPRRLAPVATRTAAAKPRHSSARRVGADLGAPVERSASTLSSTVIRAAFAGWFWASAGPWRLGGGRAQLGAPSSGASHAASRRMFQRDAPVQTARGRARSRALVCGHNGNDHWPWLREPAARPVHPLDPTLAAWTPASRQRPWTARRRPPTWPVMRRTHRRRLRHACGVVATRHD